MLCHDAQAFGIRWTSDLPLRRFEPSGDQAQAFECELFRVDSLRPRPVLSSHGRGEISPDGFRFAWDDQVTFDFVAPGRIAYLPGSDWRGHFPDSFYSTVAAMIAAWHGLLPLHATAVELDGRGLLICGAAGAGKSTLSAELISAGARLIGDDLSVVRETDAGHFDVTLGRPAMRLHPASADLVAARSIEPVPDDPRGKVLVRPVARSRGAVRLAGMVLLGGEERLLPASEAIAQLSPHRFRPAWQAGLPGEGQRRAMLLRLAGSVPILTFPEVKAFSAQDRADRIAMTMAALRPILDPAKG